MVKTLLTDSARVYENGAFVTYKLYKSGSAEKHAASDDQTLKTELIKAMNADASKKEAQGDGVYRFKINDGLGYLVYRMGPVPNEATIFHYHWNYSMDLPLTVH